MVKEIISYADDGKTVKSDVQFADSTDQYHRVWSSERNQDGTYLNTSYYGDGVSIEEEDVVGQDVSGSPIDVSIRRFRRDHSIAMMMNLDLSYVTYTVVYFSANGLPERVTETGDGNQTPGEFVKIFYPGTTHQRVGTYTDGGTTHANFWRLDGTLQYHWDMTRTSLVVTYYDVTGTKIVAQSYFSEPNITPLRADGIEVDQSSWTLNQIAEYGSTGQLNRTVTFGSGKIAEVDEYNITDGGTQYASIVDKYDPSSGMLQTKTYYAKNSAAATKTESVNKVDNIWSTIPDGELTVDTSDDLPMPPPPYDDYVDGW
jgi:hypothetical protein